MLTASALTDAVKTLAFLRSLPSSAATKELITQEEAFLLAQRNAKDALASLSEQLRIKIETLRCAHLVTAQR